jgi:hypothetical protein
MAAGTFLVLTTEFVVAGLLPVGHCRHRHGGCPQGLAMKRQELGRRCRKSHPSGLGGS